MVADNETLLITRRSLADQLVSVDLVNTTTGMVTQAIEPLKYLTEPRWLPMNDTVIWRSIGTLDNTVPGIWEPGYWARSFNPSWERQLSGRGNGASTAHDVSPDGKEFVFMSLPDGTQPLIWNQETHTLRDLPVDFAQWRYLKGIAYPLRPFYPLWHPDGDKILFHDGTWIILYDLTTNIGCDVNLMESAGRNYYIRDAQWSPDGRYLLIKNSDSPRYTSTRGPVDMFLTLDTYTGEAVQHILGHSINSFSWAADNQTIAMVAKTEEEVNGIELFGFYLFNIYSSDTQRILPSFTAGSGIKWSSDGLRLALKCRDSLPSLPPGDYLDLICISQVSSNY